MNWMEQVNNYCERTDFSFWSEPVNAITNAAFLIAAIYVFPRTKGLPLGRALAVTLFLIGLGSFAFHTTATHWGRGHHCAFGRSFGDGQLVRLCARAHLDFRLCDIFAQTRATYRQGHGHRCRDPMSVDCDADA